MFCGVSSSLSGVFSSSQTINDSVEANRNQTSQPLIRKNLSNNLSSIVQITESKRNEVNANNDNDHFGSWSTLVNKIGKLNKSAECQEEHAPDSKSCYCRLLSDRIGALPKKARYMYSLLKSMFFGKILYASNTAAHERLIRRMNATFANIDRLAKLLDRAVRLADAVTNLGEQESLALALSQQLFAARLDTNRDNFAVRFQQLIKLLIEIVGFTRNILGCVELNKFVGFENEQAALQAAANLSVDDSFWAAIIFDANANSSSPFAYKIRMNSWHTHDTQLTQDKFYTYGAHSCVGCNRYTLHGFIYLQDMLEKAIIDEAWTASRNASSGGSNEEPINYGLSIKMMPYPCYINDRFIVVTAGILPLFMVLSWLFSVSMLVKEIVHEKEKRLKEFMRMMGLANGIHWLAWLLCSLSIMLLVSLLLCLLLKFGQVTPHSDLSVLFVFFACFSLASIAQSFLMSVLFSRANLAAVIAGMLYFVLYLPYMLLVAYAAQLEPWHRLVALLCSPAIAFAYGCELLATFELQVVGLTWQNFGSNPYTTFISEYSMRYLCAILLLDAFIHFLLTWYVENVAPGEYGIRRAFYFPLQPSYWLGSVARAQQNHATKARSNSTLPKNISDIIRKCFDKLFLVY
jgi:ABC-type multidrug transport system permease subunit